VKTLTDNVFAIVRDVCLCGWRQWIKEDLQTEERLLTVCGEDKSIANRRKKAVELKDKMEKCQKQLLDI
jgi:hypothetical protein